MRATPREDRNGKSPYELVTGMKPQGPLSRVFEKVSSKTLSPHEYVRDLCAHLESIQKGVALQLSAEYAKRKFKAEQSNTNSWIPGVGDIGLLQKPPPQVQQLRDKAGGDTSRIQVSHLFTEMRGNRDRPPAAE